jgi:hypothetical protein
VDSVPNRFQMKNKVDQVNLIDPSKIQFILILGCSSTDQILDLFFIDYQFESHKPQGYWRLTWSLTSEPVELVEVRTSWPEYAH